VIHVDVDPAEIGKVRHAEVPIVGDAGRVLEQLLEAWGDRQIPNVRHGWRLCGAGSATIRCATEQLPDGPLKPQYVVEELHRITGGDATVVSGVGQHQMWASQYWKFEDPREWINSGGSGRWGSPSRPPSAPRRAAPTTSCTVDGDGCFQMTFQELITAAEERIPVKMVVFNNGVHGMVTQWQRLFYEEPLLGLPARQGGRLRETRRGDGLSRASGPPAPTRSGPPWRRRSPPTTAPSWWRCRSIPRRWCSRWSPPAAPTTSST
jgi:acetolactate synthase I/II/III large subunit